MRLPPLPPSLPLFLLLLLSILPQPTLSHPLIPPSSTTITPGVGRNLTNPTIPVSSDPPTTPSYLLNITPIPGEGSIGHTLFTLFVSSLLPEVEGVISRPAGRGALTPLDHDPWEVRRRGVRLRLESVPYSSSVSTISSEGGGGTGNVALPPPTNGGADSVVQTAKMLLLRRKRRSLGPSSSSSASSSTTSTITSLLEQAQQPQRKREAVAAAASTVDYLDYGLLHYLITELRDRGHDGGWDYGACEVEVSVVEEDGAVDVVATGGLDRKIFGEGGEGGVDVM